jgi:hypothetical protein
VSRYIKPQFVAVGEWVITMRSGFVVPDWNMFSKVAVLAYGVAPIRTRGVSVVVPT